MLTTSRFLPNILARIRYTSEHKDTFSSLVAKARPHEGSSLSITATLVAGSLCIVALRVFIAEAEPMTMTSYSFIRNACGE